MRSSRRHARGAAVPCKYKPAPRTMGCFDDRHANCDRAALRLEARITRSAPPTVVARIRRLNLPAQKHACRALGWTLEHHPLPGAITPTTRLDPQTRMPLRGFDSRVLV